ncbi:hypothetical protein H5410_019503 [Solanum commersonii]|uniref:Uncharacterized protein n=1 Tax=Solanum commersonii TaxID=4109 RepID=A0A9J5ZBD2_SOLCO|nr:hypothetical protein H5410_019503 [Solanum commersonii]
MAAYTAVISLLQTLDQPNISELFHDHSTEMLDSLRATAEYFQDVLENTSNEKIKSFEEAIRVVVSEAEDVVEMKISEIIKEESWTFGILQHHDMLPVVEKMDTTKKQVMELLSHDADQILELTGDSLIDASSMSDPMLSDHLKDDIVQGLDGDLEIIDKRLRGPTSYLDIVTISEGFIRTSSGSRESLEEVAKHYLEDLISRNLIMARKKRFNGEVIGIDLLSQSLLPAIVELAKDRHWRVRLAIIEYIPLLASQLGVGFFDDKLGTLCMQWLQDEVYSIRDAAANNLKRLAEEFGPEWAIQHIIPQVLDVINNSHYLYRMTILRAISLLAPVMGSEITCSKLLPVVITAAKDRVPNVKFNVAKVLQSLIPVVDQSVAEKTIRSSLVELAEDPDVDVRFYASQALLSIDDGMLST